MADVFPPRDLPGRAEEWGRQVENRIEAGEKSEQQLEQKVDNGLRATGGQLAVLSRQLDAVAAQQEFLLSLSTVVYDSFNTMRTVADGNWMSSPPSVQITSPSGRVEISFGGSANGGGVVFAYQIVGDSSGTIVSRNTILSDLSKRVAVTGGMSFAPSGYATVIENVPVGEPLTISLHAFADDGYPDVYIHGGHILARVAP